MPSIYVTDGARSHSPDHFINPTITSMLPSVNCTEINAVDRVSCRASYRIFREFYLNFIREMSQERSLCECIYIYIYVYTYNIGTRFCFGTIH